MGFIATVLEGFRKELEGESAGKLDIPLQQYRDAISAAFMSELRQRASAAAQFPFAAVVTPILYQTHTAVDRVYFFRGAIEESPTGKEQLDDHIFITRRRISQLHEASSAIGSYLRERGVPIQMTDVKTKND